MKKSNLKRNILECIQKVAESEIEKNKSGNSFCIAILHQPKRSKK